MGQEILYPTEFNWLVVLMGHPHQPYLQTMTFIEAHIALPSGIRLMPFIGIQAQTSGIRLMRYGIHSAEKNVPSLK